MTDLASQAVPLIALLLGAFFMWLLMNSRIKSAAFAAAAAATTALQVELAQATEKIRSATNELDAVKEDSQQKSQLLTTVRASFDELKDEQARMTERLLRLPLVEAELRSTMEQLKSSIDDARRLASSEAQKAQSIESLQEHLEALQLAKKSLDQQYRDESVRLQDSLQRKATLEEQVARIPELETKLLEGGRQFAESNSKLQASNECRVALEQQVACLPSLESKLVDSTKQLGELNVQLRESAERRVALEEQAARLPGLESQIKDSARQLVDTNMQLTDLRESSARDNGKLRAELAAERTAAALVVAELATAKTAFSQADSQVNGLTDQLTQLRTHGEAEQKSAVEKLELLLQAKTALSDQFKTLANDILEEKSKRFAEQNREGISQLLEPLKTKLTEFQGKVEEVYVNEGKDRSALSEQVRQLVELNQSLSLDAKNLTLALKGSAKTQGNWGELILERVLEASGLRKGHEYHVQDSQTREDGSRGQADVIIDLPEERKIVVDAKVSLVAYEKFTSADTDEARALSLKQHLDSVRSHIKGLSEKRYHMMYGVKSLDFVLAFVPVEPAFMTAVTNDDNLFMDAWNRNVLLVSPSTLLFVVRTVAHLWRQEAQSKNAQEIAKKGGDLYDKLCGFVEDLESVGNRLSQAQKAYDAAHGKLSVGRGNVIRQAEMLRDLGVKPTKAMSSATLAMSSDEAHQLGDNVVTLPPLTTPQSPNSSA
ncbi:DNA recombination protein RmuC [Janthinobacterium fluminis]|uniref:DNA recombination protein RmuC n=1 Tax=Janthinobacterium fluminis TaxID=2987524 RepID=A0ABT5JTV0_9BURK|nr:DNA recombination protein RmuC [Janthinobacterium fluminis]MDC8756170.1 DNA recombination protein RmuC [Janthinobacterium fluminis]